MQRLPGPALPERGREGEERAGHEGEAGLGGVSLGWQRSVLLVAWPSCVNALQPKKGSGAHASSSLSSGCASRFALNFSLPPPLPGFLLFLALILLLSRSCPLLPPFFFALFCQPCPACRSQRGRPLSRALRPCRREQFPGSLRAASGWGLWTENNRSSSLC